MMSDSEVYMDSVIALGLMYWARKALNLPARLPHWDPWLRRLWQPVVAIVVIGNIWSSPVVNWFDDLFLAAILGLGVVVGWRLRTYRPALWMAVALAPSAIYYSLDVLLRLGGVQLHKTDSGGNAEGMAFFWALIFLLVARSQSKTLKTEQAHRLAAEQEQRIIETQNQTLEYEVGQRTAALARQTDELRATLAELQATQSQLIQREKMASLGELTAGIAHEIQNPLNFVNNFADVSAELVAELEQEQTRPEPDAGLEDELLADLKHNLHKINLHGQRASSIVRGMLAHSRQSTGERQLTDLNALADEYLRLAYHGLRAKDKSFNATLETAFAPLLPLVEAVPGDLGRVLLNLLTNAFYAVQQRQQQGEAGYVPTVRVGTCRQGDAVEVRVRDNGTGIPEAAQQKIFQPFFTTKPSGQGTGLGLSLSHDIVVQGHQGTLEVASEEGQFTEFVVRLPFRASS